MRFIFGFLFFIGAILAGLTGCRKHINLPKDQVVVRNGDCSDKIAGAYICFDSLITDSRCPLGATCVWQGTAIIKVTFHENGNGHRFNMSLNEYPGLLYSSDTTINRYRIQFIDLKPMPRLNEGPVAEGVTAVLKISK